jgi:hypothetical protein
LILITALLTTYLVIDYFPSLCACILYVFVICYLFVDQIAWLFNLRGSDVTFNPVVTAYAVVLPAPGSVFLFMDDSKVTIDVAKHLNNNKIVLRPYW